MPLSARILSVPGYPDGIPVRMLSASVPGSLPHDRDGDREDLDCDRTSYGREVQKMLQES